MEWIVELLSTVGIFVGALLILVFVHELGHFLAAKLFDMRVERFSLGFPPRIWGFKRGETDYCIGATPLGGYVKITGMIDESMDTEYLEKEPEPWEFRSKPVWQRIIVISAGVIFNMILATAIFACIAFTYGEQRIPNKSISGIYVPDSSLARDVGFRTGDKLVSVNGSHPPYFLDFFSANEMTQSTLRFTVDRKGANVTLTMPDSLLDEIGSRGFIGLPNIITSQVGKVLKDSPADQAGLQTGDKIIAINGKPIQFWGQIVDKIGHSKGSLSLRIRRQNKVMSRNIKPDDNHKIGIGSAPPSQIYQIKHIKHGFFGSIGYGVHKSGEELVGILQGFKKLFSGDISVRKNLGGPVKIAAITKQQTDRQGWLGFWHITALLSVTLAIMNILPIPVLDGGHLMFLFYEGITRRKPSDKVKMALQQVGFFLIIALMIFVFFNDIIRLF